MMARPVTVAAAAEHLGKSERSVWRYARALEAEGKPAMLRVPGIAKTLVDLDLVAPYAFAQRRGNPRHRVE